MNRQFQFDKKGFLRKTDHITRPPRLGAKAKNAMMKTVRKKKWRS